MKFIYLLISITLFSLFTNTKQSEGCIACSPKDIQCKGVLKIVYSFC